MRTAVLLAVVAVALAASAAAVSPLHSLQAKTSQNAELNPRFYALEGYAGIKTPVHELITSRAAQQAGLFNSGKQAPSSGRGSSSSWESGRWDLHLSPQYQDITRGVYWNDDPEGLSFEPATVDDAFNFAAATSATLVNLIGGSGCHATPDRLTCRSHHGSLSFIHGQESAAGLDPKKTKAKMLEWAELMYKCATEQVPIDQPIKDLGLNIPDVITALGPSNNIMSLTDLFKVTATWNVRLRCAGSLAHTMEDSYAAGHARRRCVGSSASTYNVGDIVMFTAYPLQDGDKHAKFDTWFGITSLNDFSNVKDKIAHVVGGTTVLGHVTEIFRKIKAKAAWAEAKTYLDTRVWKLDPAAGGSGSGGFGPSEGNPPNCVLNPATITRGVTQHTAGTKNITITRVECVDQQEMSDDIVVVLLADAEPQEPRLDWKGATSGNSKVFAQSYTFRERAEIRLVEVDPAFDDNLGEMEVEEANGAHTATFSGGSFPNTYSYVVSYTISAAQ